MEGWNTYCTTAESLVRTKLWLMGDQGSEPDQHVSVSLDGAEAGTATAKATKG